MEKDKFFEVLESIANSLERIAVCFENLQKAPEEEALDVNAFIKEESEITEPELSTEDGKEQLESFLLARNIKIKYLPMESAADNVINSLSDFLGSRYSALKELLLEIKRNMQHGGAFSLSLRKYTQKDVSDICQFCTLLYEIAFLEQYKYSKSPQYLIRAKTTTLPVAQNFFSGQWLERFVLQSVQRAVNKNRSQMNLPLRFSYLLNPQISLPNGDDFELDLLFYVEEQFYWLEAKTGDYQVHIKKYSRMSKIMGLDDSHAMMVLTDISSDKASALTSLFSMSVLGLSQLEEHLYEVIRRDLTTS